MIDVYLLRIMFATLRKNRDLISHLRLCITITYVYMYTRMQTVEFRPPHSVILKKFKTQLVGGEASPVHSREEGK